LLIGGRKGDEVMGALAEQAVGHLMKVNGITKRQADKFLST
jgi:hypothetical protein